MLLHEDLEIGDGDLQDPSRPFPLALLAGELHDGQLARLDHRRTADVPTPSARAAAGTSIHSGVISATVVRLVAVRRPALHGGGDDAPQVGGQRPVIGLGWPSETASRTSVGSLTATNSGNLTMAQR